MFKLRSKRMKKLENVYYWQCRRLEALYGKVSDASIIAEIRGSQEPQKSGKEYSNA
jgi:hypothetical protein